MRSAALGLACPVPQCVPGNASTELASGAAHSGRQRRDRCRMPVILILRAQPCKPPHPGPGKKLATNTTVRRSHCCWDGLSPPSPTEAGGHIRAWLPIGGNGCCPGSTCKHSAWQPWGKAAGSLGLPWPALLQTRTRPLRYRGCEGWGGSAKRPCTGSPRASPGLGLTTPLTLPTRAAHLASLVRKEGGRKH